MLEAENPLAYRRYCSRLPSSASAPRLPDAGQSRTRYERCWSAVGPPGSRTRSFCTCQGLRPRRVVQALAIGAPVRMAFHIRNCVGTRDDRSFAVQWLACALPCRRFARPCGRLRTARGRCGLLLLHRKGLAPSTPCRSPGALVPTFGGSPQRYQTLRPLKVLESAKLG